MIRIATIALSFLSLASSLGLANDPSSGGEWTVSNPLLVQPSKPAFTEHFSSGQVSPRWSTSADWIIDEEVLKRVDGGKDTTRIFLKDTSFQNALVRFDFRLGNSQDLRLVTGSGGHYNAVLHIEPDHFYIQTAKDVDGPYFSYRHGECAYDFQPDRWYSMTLEFLDEELVAQLDPNHIAYAKHPILDKERRYFAFQVDAGAAEIDNVQIVSAVALSPEQTRRAIVLARKDDHPMQHTLAETYAIEKTNAHERLYQQDEEYRSLVAEVERLDQQKKEQFPEVFRTLKSIKKDISALRKELHGNDPQYKERLFATHRAARAIDQYVIAQHPEYEQLPDSQKKHRLAKWTDELREHDEFQRLELVRIAAEERLTTAYPQLFVSDSKIKESQQSARKALKDDPAFQSLSKERGNAWNQQQQYLHEQDARLSEVQSQRTATESE